MAKICDNTSVGQIIKDGENVLMIERRNYPEAYAFPAGHVDGDKSFKDAVQRETAEEVGIAVDAGTNLQIFVGDLDNPCKREGGSHHMWQVFKALVWFGKPKADSDAKEFFWANRARLKRHAERTEYFMKKYGIPYTEVGRLTKAIFGADPAFKETDPEWKQEKGLEPVWYYILKRSTELLN